MDSLTIAEKAPDQKNVCLEARHGYAPYRLRKLDSRRQALLQAAITDAPYFVRKGSWLLILIAVAKYLRWMYNRAAL